MRWWITLSILLVILVGGVGWWIMRPDDTPSRRVAAPTSSAIAPNSTPPPILPSATPAIPTTPTITPMDTDHPLSIAALRNRTYEGSDLLIEETLATQRTYTPYVVSYQSDGLKIYALLTVPLGDPPSTGWPVVIFNHGYIPPTQYRTTQRYEAYVDAFARNGYIVLKSDYRGHGSSEGDPEGAYGSPAYVIDVLNAVASMRRYPLADPDRIGMWGHSMGGYITLRAMVVDPTLKAGVIWAGVVVGYADLFEMWFRSGSRGGWRGGIVDLYGTPEENPQFWAALSANSYLTDLSGPVQIHHGTGDSTVPFEMSIILDEEIRTAGEKSELLLYSGDDHNIARNRDTALLVSVVFFDEHVKGCHSPLYCG